MTRIDRYILVLFLRTVLVCFCSIAGIFVVFHAFTGMDALVRQAETDGGLVRVMLRFYGPYMLLLFDWTGAIIALMSLLFTVGWVRFTGELTAILSVGVSHGRIFRPMVVASLLIVSLQLASREFVLPQFGDVLTLRARDIGGESEQPVAAQYDKVNRVWIEGGGLLARSGIIREPSFQLEGDYPGYGDMLVAKTAHWQVADAQHPAGYLLSGVTQPRKLDTLASVAYRGRKIMMTPREHSWLEPNQCFFATTVDSDLLRTNQSSNRKASVYEIAHRVRNPAVHSSKSLQVLLHERIIRAPLDFSLILLGLPLVVNRRGRNVFVMIGAAMMTVVVFFAIKTLSGAMGGNGYLLSPAMAAWIPLLVLGPVAYVRYRDVQLV